MNNTPMTDAERRRKANDKRVFLRAGVVRNAYASDHPMRQLIAKYESLTGRTKTDWMLDLLLVGSELDRLGLAEGLATMIRNGTVNAAGGVIVAAERLQQLHGGAVTARNVPQVAPPPVAPTTPRMETPAPVLKAVDTVAPEPVSTASPERGMVKEELTDMDMDMGFGDD